MLWVAYPYFFFAVRGDWHLSYDHGDWAFAPAEHTLLKIVKYFKATNFDEVWSCLYSDCYACSYLKSQPYPGFDPDELQDYVFVPLPTLQKRYILRQTYLDEDEDKDDGDLDSDGVSDDDSEGGDDLESGDDGGGGDDGHGEYERGDSDMKEEGEGEDEKNMVAIEDGKAIVHVKPFSGFPLLKHHAHPYFVIFNALPKLQKHKSQLCQEHFDLLALMSMIEIIWISRVPRLCGAPLLSKQKKRPRPSDESHDNEDDAHDDQPKRQVTRGATKRHKSELPQAGVDQKKTYETCGRADVGKGKGKAGGLGKTMPAQPQESQHPIRVSSESPISQSSIVKASRAKAFLFGDISEVAAWAAAVAAAGPPEVTDEVVIWSDEEPVRSPIQDWDKWHVPYKQPKQQARFCSSDWPMYFYSFPLWRPSANATGSASESHMYEDSYVTSTTSSGISEFLQWVRDTS